MAFEGAGGGIDCTDVTPARERKIRNVVGALRTVACSKSNPYRVCDDKTLASVYPQQMLRRTRKYQRQESAADNRTPHELMEAVRAIAMPGLPIAVLAAQSQAFILVRLSHVRCIAEGKGRESFSESRMVKNADVSVRKRLLTLWPHPDDTHCVFRGTSVNSFRRLH